MADTNRCRVSLVRESTMGTTPATPRMRTARITGESLSYSPKFVSSDEIRSDRSSADPIFINQDNSGSINFELFYPQSKSAQSEIFASSIMSDWINTPEHDNDGTADSVITGLVTSTGTATVIDQSGSGGFSGTAYKVGHLVRSTGFALAGNNVVRRVTASTATTVVIGAAGFSADDTSPVATARLKVVGIEGVSGDITALADGIGATTLALNSVGLRVGQWIKLGGTAVGNKFATAACNDWIRITAISATKLTCDNLPTGWITDAGASKTIRVFFGDVLQNGTSLIPLSVERSFLDQTIPTHVLQRGLLGGSLSLDYANEAIIKAQVDLSGMNGQQSATPTGTTYAAAPTGSAMSANVSVGRVAENGATVSGPNFVKSAKVSLANNLRQLTAVGNIGAVGVGVGELQVTGTLETYFGDATLYAKLLAGTPSSVSFRATLAGQAIIVQLPRIIYTGGAPNASQKNADVTIPLAYTASYDAVTGAQILIDRVEYSEV